MLVQEGYPYLLAAAVVTAVAFALALRLRSWPLWLLAFLLSVGTLCVAWYLRAPVTPSSVLDTSLDTSLEASLDALAR